MKRNPLYILLAIAAFLTLTAAGASRFINGTEIPQSVTLLYSTGSQSATLGATTVTTLSASSNVAVTGNVTVSGNVIRSVTPTITAAGSSKTDCTQVATDLGIVSTATALQGVCLPAAATGARQRIVNVTSVSIVVYPLDSSDDIIRMNGFAALATDAGWVLGPRGAIDCEAGSTSTWYCRADLGLTGAVAATGTNQATATALASVNMGSHVRVTGADGTKAITLPTGSDAECIRIHSVVNTNTAYLPVFGHVSDDDTINGAAADAVFTMGAGADVMFCTTDGIAWTTY